MKLTVTETMFRDAFQKLRPESFSYEGLSILFEWLEGMDREAQEEMELDVIAICREWSEYTFEEFLQEYDIETIEDEDEEALEERIEGYLQDRTSIAGFADNSVVFANY